MVSNDFLGMIKERQLSDPKLQKTVELLGTEKAKVCIPEDMEVKSMILEEGHKSHFSMHPGMTKMYQDLRKSF